VLDMKIVSLQVTGAENKKNPYLQIEVADSFFRRFLGLMGRKRIANGTGLLIAPCNSIHMCFMRFKIDVVYLDKNYRVLKTVENILPWIGLSCCFKAWAVLELPAGEIKRQGIGKDMVFRPVD